MRATHLSGKSVDANVSEDQSPGTARTWIIITYSAAADCSSFFIALFDTTSKICPPEDERFEAAEVVEGTGQEGKLDDNKEEHT